MSENIIERASPRAIIITYRPEIKDFKDDWFTTQRKSLPNNLLFWGMLIVGTFLCALFFWDSLLGKLFMLAPLQILIYISIRYLENYRAFMALAKQQVTASGDYSGTAQLLIEPAGDGVNFVWGEDYSFMSWSSVKSVSEQNDRFSFISKGSAFSLKKADFADADDILRLRRLLVDKLGDRLEPLR